RQIEGSGLKPGRIGLRIVVIACSSQPRPHPSPETARSRGLLDVDVEAEGTDSAGEFQRGSFGVSGSTVIGSEVLVVGSVFEHMVDDAQYGGCDGDDRLLVAEARLEAEVSRPEAGIFHLDRRQSGLHEHGFEPGRALAQAPRSLSAGAFVEPRT